MTAPEHTEGSFTVSNLGMRGSRCFAAVINSPQVGNLAVVRERFDWPSMTPAPSLSDTS